MGPAPVAVGCRARVAAPSSHGMQRRLGEAVWDVDAVRDDARGYAQAGGPTLGSTETAYRCRAQ
jgi:hypothetical protein